MATASMPFWPRLLSAELAAAYVGVCRTTYLAGVDAGVWPQPLRYGKRTLWDRVAIDRVIDAQSGMTDVPAVEEPGHGWEHVGTWARSN